MKYTSKARTLAAALITIGLLAGGANAATTIFDNGSPITSSEGWDATGFIEADDFSVAANSSITQATIYIYDDPGPWDGTLEYFLYSESGLAPDAILSSGEGQSPTIALTGLTPVTGGGEIQAVTFTLESPFSAQAGITYWFGMHLKSDYARTDTRWAVSAQTGNHRYQSGGVDAWSTGGSELAFELSSIPEPSSAFLLGLGALGIAAIRRRIN